LSPSVGIYGQWLDYGVKTQTFSEGTYEVQVMKRFANIYQKKPNPYEVGSLIRLKVPRTSQMKINPKEILETLKRGFEEDSFSKKKIKKDVWLYQGEWSYVNRTLRLLVDFSDKKSITYISSVVRSSYDKSAGREALEWQLSLLDKQKQFSWINFFIPSAYANSTMSGCCVPGGSASCALMSSVCRGTSRLPQNGGKTFRRYWNSGSDLATNALGLAEDISDPKKFRAWAFAGAMGATLGAFAGHFVAKGIFEGITALGKAAIGIERRKEMEKAFIKAREMDEKLREELIKAENQIDSVIGAIDALAEVFGETPEGLMNRMGGVEELSEILKPYRIKKEALQSKVQFLEKKKELAYQDAILLGRDPMDSQSCHMKLSAELLEVKDEVNRLQTWVSDIENAVHLKKDCLELKKSIGLVLEGEADVQKTYSILNANVDIFVLKHNQEQREIKRNFKKGARRRGFLKKRYDDASVQSLTSSERDHRRNKRLFIRECLSHYPLPRYKYRGLCGKHYDESSFKRANDQAKKDTRRSINEVKEAVNDYFKQRKDQTKGSRALYNPALANQKLTAVTQWLTKIDHEQHCKAFPDEKVCLSLEKDPDAGVLSRFQSIRKKKKKIEELCSVL
tara:strand:+ start:934 stop:2802 length:1869 start_codon:yes stop_codon:yes gene_type:complete